MSRDPTLDPEVAAYLAADEAGAEQRLGRLLVEVAAPLVDRVTRAQLGSGAAGEVEDVAAGALLRLTERLRRLRLEPVDASIESFEAYVVATARNACRAHLRARRPEWVRLSNQVRYLLGHDPAFAAWRADDGRRLAGLAGWRGRAAGGPERVEVERLGLGRPAAAVDLAVLLRSLLMARGAPCPVVALVAELADLRGLEEIRDVPLGPEEGSEAPGVELVSNEASAERVLAERGFLELVWSEVRELPVGQRRALLLNLRDPRGGDLLSLMPTAGIAGVDEIAGVIELPRRELEALWERLPLDDREIGERFDLSQRQIVNLRKSGRERLARRMRRLAGGR